MQSAWDFTLQQINAIKSSVFGGTSEPKDWKKLIIPSAVVLTSSAAIAFALGEKLRARKHDNIPLLAPEDVTYYGGHLDVIEDDFYPTLYEMNVKANFPALTCLITPGPRRWILLQDPKLVKFVYETHFNDISKGDSFKEEYKEALGQGIFASDGKAWKMHRKVASRMFSMKNMKSMMYDVTKKNVLIAMDKIGTLITDDDVIDIKDLLGRFTLDTFVEAAFGVNIGAAETYPERNAFGDAFDDMVVRIEKREVDIFWKVKRMLGVSGEAQIAKEYEVVKAFADDIFEQKDNMEGGVQDVDGQRTDLLSLFLKHNPEMSRDELKDVAFNFIIAGRDTTRMLMTFLIYVLCQDENRSVRERVVAEVDGFEEQNGKGPEYSDMLNGFRYLEGALCETLRLYPSVPCLGRHADKDIELPIQDENGKNYVIRKGDDVLSATYVTARTPRIWGDDCLEIKPERWSKGVNTFDQYKFAHFNVNPRLCLGKQFAITEAKTFMYHLLKNFTFELVEDKPLKLVSGVILNFEGPLKVKITARK